MKNFILSLFCLVFFLSCKKNKNEELADIYEPRGLVQTSIDEFIMQGTTIRALHVVNDSVVWFAGSNGMWGYTLDNGKNWNTNELTLDNKKPDFRSIAITNNNIFLVSVSQPAAVLKSADNGVSWNKVYEDSTDNAFFDAIAFSNQSDGIVLGDPNDGCFHFGLTKNNGDHWEKVKCNAIPEALSSEAPFAASNTNIAVFGNNIWIGTGGKTGSRVYHTADKGITWNAYSTPILSGGVMTGIYSISFYDQNNGIVCGGDWDNVSENTNNIAVTNDGGKNWSIVASGNNGGYGSCVKYIPETQGKEIFMLGGRALGGNSYMSYSNDNGNNWQNFANSNYLTMQFANKNTAWIAGKNKIAKLNLN